MAAIKLHLVLLAVVALTPFVTCKNIKILSDFSTSQNKEFFKTTFPWIAKNIGPKLHVKYYFKDAPDGGKRMCVMDNLKRNLLLQANYLKCEANEETNCLRNMPIDQRKLDKCIRKIHKKIRAAEKEFRKYGTSETPLIIIGRSRQTVHDPMTVLLNICGIFGRKQPEGCRKPSEAPKPATPTTTEPCTQPPSTKPTSGTTPKNTSDATSPMITMVTEPTTSPPIKTTTLTTTSAIEPTTITPSETTMSKITLNKGTEVKLLGTVVWLTGETQASLSNAIEITVLRDFKVTLPGKDKPTTVLQNAKLMLQSDAQLTLPNNIIALVRKDTRVKLLDNTEATEPDNNILLPADTEAELSNGATVRLLGITKATLTDMKVTLPKDTPVQDEGQEEPGKLEEKSNVVLPPEVIEVELPENIDITPLKETKVKLVIITAAQRVL